MYRFYLLYAVEYFLGNIFNTWFHCILILILYLYFRSYIMTELNKQNDTTQDSFIITPKKFENKHKIIISDSSDEEINSTIQDSFKINLTPKKFENKQKIILDSSDEDINDITQDTFLITTKKFGNKHRIISDSSDEEINIEPTPLKESVSFFFVINLIYISY